MERHAAREALEARKASNAQQRAQSPKTPVRPDRPLVAGRHPRAQAEATSPYSGGSGSPFSPSPSAYEMRSVRCVVLPWALTVHSRVCVLQGVWALNLPTLLGEAAVCDTTQRAFCFPRVSSPHFLLLAALDNPSGVVKSVVGREPIAVRRTRHAEAAPPTTARRQTRKSTTGC